MTATPPAPPAPGSPAGGPDAEWQHFHPLSPLLRGGVALLAVLGYLASRQLDRLFGAEEGDPTQGHLLAAALAGVAVLALMLAGSWISWRVTRFRLGPTVLELRTGLLFRQHRQVRYDRVQAVEVVRPLVARVAGLSEVVVQAAGGRDANARLAYLGDARARELREVLIQLARQADAEGVVATAGGVTSARGAAAGVPGETFPGVSGARSEPLPRGHLVAVVPNARLVQSTLFSGPAVFVAVSVPVLMVAIAGGIPGIVPWLGPTAIGVGFQLMRRLLRQANFVLTQDGATLRIRHGLTDLRATAIPLHRVQAVDLHQPLLWRIFGWWQVRVNVAGVHGSGEDAETTVVPVGMAWEALAVLGLVRPALPPAAAVAAMTGSMGDGFVTASGRARWLDPVGWRRRGYAVTQDALVTRAGALGRVAQVVPHARVQSLRLEQGLAQRRAGVATVRLVSTPGPVHPAVEHLDVEQATRLFNEQVARSAAARVHS